MSTCVTFGLVRIHYDLPVSCGKVRPGPNSRARPFAPKLEQIVQMTKPTSVYSISIAMNIRNPFPNAMASLIVEMDSRSPDAQVENLQPSS